MGLKEACLEYGWINWAEDRIPGRAVVNAVMNLRIL
jgi:hypothetical protein